MTKLSDLPENILISTIIKYLKIKDLLNIYSTNRYYKYIIEQSCCILLSQYHWIDRKDSNKAVQMIKQLYHPYIFLIGGYENNRQVDLFDLHSKTIIRGGVLSYKRTQDFDVVYHNGRVYVISGCTDSTLGKVETYNIFTNSWTTCCSLPQPLVSTATVSYDNSIYLFGGYNHCTFKSSSDIYCYNDLMDSWTLHDISLPFPRKGHAATIYNNSIWISGGSTPGSIGTNTTDIFLINERKWIIGPSMNRKRIHFSFVVIKGKLYAVGGDIEFSTTNYHTIELYDLANNVWRIIHTYIKRRIRSARCCYGELILSFGGSDGSFKWLDYDTFNPITNEYCNINYNINGRSTGMTLGKAISNFSNIQ